MSLTTELLPIININHHCFGSDQNHQSSRVINYCQSSSMIINPLIIHNNQLNHQSSSVSIISRNSSIILFNHQDTGHYSSIINIGHRLSTSTYNQFLSIKINHVQLLSSFNITNQWSIIIDHSGIINHGKSACGKSPSIVNFLQQHRSSIINNHHQ
jgi:hypothetical protein